MARGDWVDAGYGSFTERTGLKSGFYWRYANTLEEAIIDNKDVIQVIPYGYQSSAVNSYNLSTLTSTLKYKIGTGTQTTLSMGTRYDFSRGGTSTRYYFKSGTPDSSGHVLGRMSGGTSFSSVEGKTGYGFQFEVPHEADGSVGTLNLIWFFNGSSTHGDCTKNVNIVLDTIPRGSILNQIDNFGLDETAYVSITKNVLTYTDNLVISYGETTIKTINGIADGDAISFTTAEQTTIQGLMSSPEIELTFTLSSYDGTTLIGSSVQTASITALDQPLCMSKAKTIDGKYRVAINGLVDADGQPLQVYDDDGNEWLMNQFYYKAGDTYTISGSYMNVGGCLTSSRGQVRFGVFTPKLLTNITSVTVTYAELAIRNTAGTYIVDEGTVVTNSVTAGKGNNDNAVHLIYTKSSMSGTNNTPVAVQIRNLTLTFN